MTCHSYQIVRIRVFRFSPLLLLPFSVGCQTGERVHPVDNMSVEVRPASMRAYRMPVYFERLPGQEGVQPEFIARGLRHELIAGTEGLTVRFRTGGSRSHFDINYSGASGTPTPRGSDPLDSYSSYFIGGEPEQWTRRSQHYERVHYPNVYPGIDVDVYGTEDYTLEFDFVVHPGANPRLIELRLEGVDSHRMSSRGDLEIVNANNRIVIKKPVLYQNVSGIKRSVEGAFALGSNGLLRFDVGPYDLTKELIIDPELVYSTRLGGSGGDGANAVIIDHKGSVIVAGSTGSTDFPVADGYAGDADGATADLFVTKFDPGGNLVFSTYIGGTSGELMGCDGSPPGGLDLDPDGNIWIVARTTSLDYPTREAIRSEIAPSPGRATPFPDVAITSLAAAGDDLIFSTYYGGEGLDEGCGLDVDGAGNVYVTGMTGSDQFHPAGNVQVKKGAYDGFVLKLGPDHTVAYSTYLGGNEVQFYEKGTDVAAGPDGLVYVVGYSDAPDFPPVPAEEAILEGLTDAFLVKLNADGSISDVVVDLGGSQTDIAHAVDIDIVGGRIAVVGLTASNDFPVQGGPFPAPSDLSDQFLQNGFMSVFDLAGETMWSSNVGGSGTDVAFDVSFTAGSRAVVVGSTGSPEFPPEGSFQGPGGNVDVVPDGFVVEVDVAEPSLTFWSFLGGSSIDNAHAVDGNSSGGFAVSGVTYSADFEPLVDAYQPEARANDAFVLAFGGESEPGITVTPNPVQFPITLPGETSSVTVTVSSSGAAPLEIQNIDVEPTSVFRLPEEPDFPVTLDPGETLMFDVEYSPAVPSSPSLPLPGADPRNEGAAPSARQGTSDGSLAAWAKSDFQSGISNQGTLTVVSNAPTSILAVPLRAGGIVVNDAGDREDPTPDDGNCDVDAGMDGNQCTLRAAIETVNGLESDDVTQIAFAIDDSDIPVIDVDTDHLLPFVLFPIEIDATTQPHTGRVIIRGNRNPNDPDDLSQGLTLEAAGSIARGLVVEGFRIGFALTAHSKKTIDDCLAFNNFVGVSITGSNHTVRNCTIEANNVGVAVTSANRILLEDNTIGGDVVSQFTGVLIDGGGEDTLRSNTIVLNEVGVRLRQSNDNVIEGNLIGTDEAGSEMRGNGTGIEMSLTSGNVLRNNTISGNFGVGVMLSGSSGARLESNRIGVDQAGVTPIGNGAEGVMLRSSWAVTLRDNVVADNGKSGVAISGRSADNRLLENWIGTNAMGNQAFANALHGVEIRGPGGGTPPTESGRNQLSGNVISGNFLNGVFLADRAFDTRVRNNKIGVDGLGSHPLPNGGNGIEMQYVSLTNIAQNTISGNEGNGVFLAGDVGARYDIRENKIGTSTSGLEAIGNGRNGILIGDSGAIIEDNTVSANTAHGIELHGVGPGWTSILKNNRIGSDQNRRDIRGDMGNRGSGLFIDRAKVRLVRDNFIAFNHENGVLLRETDGPIRLQQNTIERNIVGIRFQDANDTWIFCNTVRRNIERNIETEGDENTVMRCNEIAESEGSSTGIYLTSSTNATIEGNLVYADAGDAIAAEGATGLRVVGNSIFENLGLGLNNHSPSTTIDAVSNWWGHASGPSGTGSGSGNGVSAGVNFSGWRTEPIAVVAAVEADTINLPVGTMDTTRVYLQNWIDRDDRMLISVFDMREWLISLNAFEVDLTDSSAAGIDLVFAIPPGTSDAETSEVVVIATSGADAMRSAEATLVVRAETSNIQRLVVAPDSVLLAYGDTTIFTAQGFDQFDRPYDTEVGWFAEGGAIDENGMYVAGSETGTFEVTATTGFGGPTATAIVTVVMSTVDTDEEEPPVPNSFALHPNYPNPFNPSTTITYDVPRAADVRIAIYDALGRRVEVLGRWHRAPGTYTANWNADRFPSGIYFCRLETAGFAQVKKMILLR